MKHNLRGLLCAAGLAAVLGTAALAAPVSDISIKLNGQPLTFTDAVPQIVHNRTYLPFRTVFVALGFADENITYDGEARKVTAEGDDVTISMVIGENQISVTRDGETEILEIDAPAFIDPTVNRTLVPARFISEAAGYNVGWDGKTRTVLIDDVEVILSSNQETYQVLDLYLDYVRKFQDKNQQIRGEFASAVTTLEDKYALGGGYEMLLKQGSTFDFAIDLRLSGEMDGQQLETLLPEGLDLELRGDLADGIIYFKADALTAMLGDGVSNLWFKLQMPEQSRDDGGTGLLQVDAESGQLKGKDYVEYLMRSRAKEDPSTSMADRLVAFNAMLGDSAFEKDGNDYVAKFEQDGTATSVVITTSGGKANGCGVILSSCGENEELRMQMLMKDQNLQLAYQQSAEGSTVEMMMNGVYSTVKQEPQGVPGEDAAVMDLSGIAGEEFPLSAREVN